MLKIGSVIGGKYEVISLIGQGGMSRVYMVRNQRTNVTWAIKEVRKDGSNSNEVIRQNLITEAEILKGLRHPHLPQIVDIIDRDDTYLIMMDYIEGMPLSQVLKERGPQKQSDVVKWSLQMCDVLGYLHSRNPKIIYRDMKPSNIMLQPNGDVVLIDFGTAREYKEESTSDTTYFGTRNYAAPEQIYHTAQTDERTDIFNLGATMHQLLTGQVPLSENCEFKPIRHYNPELSAGLEQIILKCTKWKPEDRYQNCGELKYALLHYEEMAAQGIRKRRGQFRIFVAACVASVAALAVGAGLRMQAGNVLRDTFESVMMSAETALDDSGQEAGYIKAISVKPEDSTPYLDLLNKVYLKDGTFSQEEAESMTRILGTKTDSGKTYESELKKNNGAYDEVAFQLGIAYFYYYGTSGNKQASKAWFDIAASSETLSESQVTRASIFSEIASYYDQLGSRDRAGDNTVSYADYWYSMDTLTSGDLAAVDNTTTALVAYTELVGQIRMHANDFLKAGVSSDAVSKKLDDIESHLDSDFSNLTEEESDMKDTLQSSIASARSMLANAAKEVS